MVVKTRRGVERLRCSQSQTGPTGAFCFEGVGRGQGKNSPPNCMQGFDLLTCSDIESATTDMLCVFHHRAVSKSHAACVYQMAASPLAAYHCTSLRRQETIYPT